MILMFGVPLGGRALEAPGAPRELAHCFPEFRSRVDRCKYADCSHVHEPGCAVITAVAAGEIAADRLESYRTLLLELQGLPRDWE